jgi:putative DNA primase/helicase
MACDRGNYGRIVADYGERVYVHFVSPDGREATVPFPRADLRDLDGRPLATASGVEPDPDFVRFISDPPEPRPVVAKLLPVLPLLPEMIPEPFRNWLTDVAKRMQCPLDFPAVGAVVALASIVGRQIVIKPKRLDDWSVVPILWGATIGRPGVMKTPALQASLDVVGIMVNEAEERYEREEIQSKVALAVQQVKATAAREALKKAAKKAGATDAELEKLAAALPETRRPHVPKLRRYIVNDPSVEKLGEIHRDNPNGLLLFRDELTGFLRTMEKYGHEGDRAFFLESWNGSNPFTCDRIERGTVHIPALVLSILGGIQPGPLGQYLRAAAAGVGAQDDGLIQRFQLMVYPDPPGPWVLVDERPDVESRGRAYAVFKFLDGFDPAQVGAVVGDDNAPLPYLHFDDRGQERFFGWWAELEAQIRSGCETPAIESHLSKYRSLMPSLALVFHLVDVADGAEAGPVSLGATELAVRWCTYLETHARRVYTLATGADTEPARLLAERIVKGEVNNPFTAREVLRKGWVGLTDSNDVAIAVGLLEEYGWIMGVERLPGPEGGRRTTVYHLSPRVRRNAPQPSEAAALEPPSDSEPPA